MRGGDRVEEDAATGVLVWPLLEVRILAPEVLKLQGRRAGIAPGTGVPAAEPLASSTS